jgi:hypothetical protein
MANQTVIKGEQELDLHTLEWVRHKLAGIAMSAKIGSTRLQGGQTHWTTNNMPIIDSIVRHTSNIAEFLRTIENDELPDSEEYFSDTMD